MKKALLALASLLILASPASAQWQVPAGSVPVGRGGGATGFSSVPLGTSGAAIGLLNGNNTYSGNNTFSGGFLLGAANAYLNFGSTFGAAGYGFRDNAGAMQFKNSGGAWANVGKATYNCPYVEQFGGAADNSVDNAGPILAALASNTNFPCVRFGPGKYRVNSNLAVTVGVNGLAFIGEGQDITELTWPNINGGVTVSQSGKASRFIFRDMAMTTDNIGSGTAISATYVNASSDPNFIVRVSFRGADSPEYCKNNKGWGYGMKFVGVWNINLDQVYVFCANIGLRADGEAGGNPTGVLNVTDSTFDFNNYGFVYGVAFQGVSIKGSNFTGCNLACIATVATSPGPQQQDMLSISTSQFNAFGTATGILISGALRDFMVNSSLFLSDAGGSGIIADGGSLMYFSSIMNNSFGGPGASSGNAVAVFANGPENAGVISGNVVSGFTTGFVLGGGSKGWNVYGNAYRSITTHVNNAGTGNSVGAITD